MPISHWITHEAYKLTRRLPFAQPEPLTRLRAARRQEACFQLILRGDSPLAVNVGQGPWYSGRASLPTLRVAVEAPFAARLFHEGMLPDDEGLDTADILLTQPVVELAAGETCAVWIEIAVPPEAEPGTYPVALCLYLGEEGEAEAPLARVELPLEVADVLLPAPGEYRTYLDLWQHPSNVARQYEVEPWSDAHFAALEGIAASLAQLGQKAVTLVVSEAPWRAQENRDNFKAPSNLFEYSMVRIRRDPAGELHFDFTPLQRYIDLFARHGIDRELSLYGLIRIWRNPRFPDTLLDPEYPEALLLRCYDEASGTYGYLNHLEDARAYLRALEQYFVSTGQMGRVRVAADEPGDMEKYGASLTLIQKTAPAFRYKTSFDNLHFLEPYGEGMSDFAPQLTCACRQYDQLKALQARRPGGVFLWYICVSPSHPNTFLASPLLEGRFLGTLNALLDFDGILRWAYCCWTWEPRRDQRYRNLPAGDLCLVYPARDGGVLLSLRWKALRRGLEDHELILRLRDAGREEVVRQVFALLSRREKPADFVDATGGIPGDICSLDYADYERARGLMLDALAGKA